MTHPNSTPAQSRKRHLLLGIIAIVLLAFAALIALVINNASGAISASPATTAYLSELATALDGADASIGAELVQSNDCAACHLTGDGSVSPLFTGIADLAAERRPPLTAEQYLYEAILFPAAHPVEGYTNAMPNNYGDRLSLQEVGNMIAYLLTLTSAESSS